MEKVLALSLAYLPPAQYDHPFGGTLEIVRMDSIAAVKRQCPETYRPMACARGFRPEKCFIFILPEAGLRGFGFNPDYVLKHEIAHCNGWAGDHPGALTEAEYRQQVEALVKR